MTDETRNEETAPGTPRVNAIRVGLRPLMVFGNLHRTMFEIYELPGRSVQETIRWCYSYEEALEEILAKGYDLVEDEVAELERRYGLDQPGLCPGIFSGQSSISNFQASQISS